MGKITLILGGSNSGKSKFAQSLLRKYKDVLYLATAEVFDEEMKEKVEKHRQLRPEEWTTIEEPVHIDKVMEEKGEKYSAILIECILLFINNIIIKYSHLQDDEVERVVLDKVVHVMEAINKSKANCYVVSGETGLGFIGENKPTRLYGRVLGQVNQMFAQNAVEVFFVVAGIPMQIK